MEQDKRIKKDKAQAMVVVFIYISVVSLISIYMMVYGANLHKLSIHQINRTKAFYAGEAALIQSLIQLNNVVDGTGNIIPGTAADANVNMVFPPMTITATGRDLGNGYVEVTAIVEDWRKATP